MNSTTKSEKNGTPPASTTTDEESAARLLSPSKTSSPSLEASQPKNGGQEVSEPFSRQRSFPTVWDLQKRRIPEGDDIKVYKRRWIMLFIFALYGLVGAFQWCMFVVIANVVTKYYNVPNLAVDFTAMAFLICYLVGFLPAAWILNNWGLRWSMLIASSLNALGCFLRVFSVPSDRFWLILVGQSFVGMSLIFCAMMPTRLAAVWFPADQVSFACAFGLNGILIGASLGFLGPPLLVTNSDSMEEIAADLNREYIILAAVGFITLILTLAFFQDTPPLPPSQAEKQRIYKASQNGVESAQEFLDVLRRLFKGRDYLILLFTLSFNMSVFTAMGTRLNQLLITHFPGKEKEVGIIGLLLVAPGLLSAGICGYILDRTHAFKETTMGLYFITLTGWIAFSIFLQVGDMTWIYVATMVLGLATNAVQPVILDFAVEITYPEPEAAVSGLLMAIAQIFGVIFTLAYGFMLEEWNDNVANIVMMFPLVIAPVCVAFMRPKLRRQAAQQSKSAQPLEVLGS